MQRRVIEAAEQRVARWKLHLSWIVLALGMAATIVIWRSIAAHEVEEISWTTQLAAQSIATDLREDMEWQRTGLDRLALLWETTSTSESLWTRNAELYMQHRPGCIAVERIAADGKRIVSTRARAGSPLAFNGVPTVAMDIARNTRTTVFSTTDAVGDGNMQWAVVHPVYVGNQFRGYVASFFDVARTINENLADVADLGFSFSVLFPTQHLEHALPQTNREYERQWATTVSVPLPGVKWQVRVWPNPNTMVRVRSLLPLVTLAVGTVLSLLASLTFYFAARVARSSARIEVANEALQREIAERQGMEKELRRARDDLDARVQVRTAELATANVLLQREITGHQHAEDSLRQLTGRLFQLRDEEQRRLARELHDGATQTLIALSMNLALIRDADPSNNTKVETLVNDSSRLLKQCTEELRTISYLLHPPLLNELGLVAALHDFVDGFEHRSGIRVRLSIDPALGRFGQQLELTVFRVVQEALSNVRRHAQSRTATISLEQYSNLLHLEISDEGRGIPPEVFAATETRPAGLGIAGMQERVRLVCGHLEIHSDSAGTKVRAVLPVDASGASAKKVVAASRARSEEGPTAAAA